MPNAKLYVRVYSPERAFLLEGDMSLDAIPTKDIYFNFGGYLLKIARIEYNVDEKVWEIHFEDFDAVTDESLDEILDSFFSPRSNWYWAHEIKRGTHEWRDMMVN